MSSPSRSLFGSFKDKLSRKSSRSSSRSTSPNPTFAATAKSPSARNDAPPPPYSPIDLSSGAPAELPASTPMYPAANPLITINPAPTPDPIRPSFSSARSDRSITSPEDPYAFLSSFDTVFLIDDSGSMAGRSWREVQEALRALAPICTAHDDNGIDVYFLNARNTSPPNNNGPQGYTNIRTATQVERLFNAVRPAGGTPTGTRINHILKPYLREYERAAARTGNPDDCGVKPVNMIVITDGVPTDDPESVIISVARKLDALEAPPHQVGIQFFQVGREPGAAEALRELDDGLAEQGGGVRDMVDTVTWDGKEGSKNVLSADAILKVVLGAVVKRLDRRPAGASAAGQRGGRLAP